MSQVGLGAQPRVALHLIGRKGSHPFRRSSLLSSNRSRHRFTTSSKAQEAAVARSAAKAVEAPAPAHSPAAGKAEYPGPIKAHRPPKHGWKDAIVLQAFGWESCNEGDWWSVVKAKVPEIKEAGFTHVWLPPPSKSVARQGYLPSQLYDLHSAYGTYASLVALNTALLEAGLRPIADVVINHRCADERDERGLWNKFRDDVPHPGRRIDWGRWAITGDDPEFGGKGNHDSGDDFGPSPDLDHTNKEVFEGLVDWINWLQEYLGFEGLRIDFAKGFSADITRRYLERTLKEGQDLAVAEYWVDAKWNGSELDFDQNDMRQRLCDWLDEAKHAAAFDFPTKAILQEAVRHCQYDRLRDKDGKAPGLLGWWPSLAVTFVDNHDTGSTQQHWPFPEHGVMQGYAYILTHPGIPTIFWEHFYDWGLKDELVKLVQLRHRAGIDATSKLEILAAEGDMYVAKVGGELLLKLGPRYDMGHLAPGKEWKKEASGKDWCVWKRTEK